MNNYKQLSEVVRAVLTSSKYKNVDELLIRTIGERELSNRKNVREAIKATKNKLHQVGAAYFDASIDYPRILEKLKLTAEGDSERFRELCLEAMKLHASTRERIGIIDDFFATTLSGIKPVRSIIDIACGLNPLATPWMNLENDTKYYAYDIYKDMILFIQQFFPIAKIDGNAAVLDITRTIPTRQVDLVFLLKAIPCLEQLDKNIGHRLLESLNAKHLLFSFPVRSLGGRNKGMAENYEIKMVQLLHGKPWHLQKFEFVSELAFLVTK